ncbi:type IX secretion system membrane protein, PorP/SprF family [Paenimyroides aquimaris]|uniref:Type IX secretion system membrane protein, PorP/SprF family n=1 Tax=Paenimyroides marinum TaxID=1159016 RepID=A0A1H6IYT8_9FLAO|nr:type IX secretion system membrane protein PorP/SprF [Paenimyroides aquimaris]SEH54415.1 type IX secretion system membrane protein, PorP/SprF family [Paenimyroides aquimaris]
MNIFTKSLLVAISSLFVSQISSAQEGISVYQDYLTDNYYLIHPSMAGIANCAKVRLTARQQWFGEKDAPALQTASFNTAISERSGVGIIAFNDRNGYHKQVGAKLTYAHHITFSRSDYDLNKLSFGVSAGMVNSQLDQTEWGHDFDPSVNGSELKYNYFNVDAGLSYHFLDFYAHATVKNLITSDREIYSDIESDNLRKYIVSAGYVFSKNRGYRSYRDQGFSWEPSVLFQYTEETQEKMLDLNLKMYKEFSNGQFFAGISYRTMFDQVEYMKDSGDEVKKQGYHSVSPILGVKFKNILVGYTYSHQFGDVRFANGGFHQLTLGFNFLCRESNYKCDCPSVNF